MAGTGGKPLASSRLPPGGARGSARGRVGHLGDSALGGPGVTFELENELGVRGGVVDGAETSLHVLDPEVTEE